MAAAADDFEKDGAPGANILDVLDPDCWRAVLDHLDIDDVVRSERVSRGWQTVVLDYLEGVHNFKITLYPVYGVSKMDKSGKYDTYRRVKLNRQKSYLYEEMLRKIGRYITTMVTDAMIESRLRIISQNCPNLQAITFFRISNGLRINDLGPCNQLKRMVFESCSGFREYYLDLLLVRGSAPIEELTFNYCDHVFGSFLKRMPKPIKLKSLQINKCALDIQHMVKALDSLTELVKLELNDNRLMDLRVLHICLEKMPKLEYLSLNGYKSVGLESDVLFESIGRLGGLKYLSLRGNRNVDDAWVTAIARGCKELSILDIGDCEDVSGRAVAALCAARAQTLRELVVRGNPNVTDADLAACVASCRYLTSLDASGCAGVTEGLAAAAAAAARDRSPPLRLRISDEIPHEQVYYKGVIVERDTPAPDVYYSDSDYDYDDSYDRYYTDSDEGTWSDRVEEYLDNRDPSY